MTDLNRLDRLKLTLLNACMDVVEQHDSSELELDLVRDVARALGFSEGHALMARWIRKRKEVYEKVIATREGQQP